MVEEVDGLGDQRLRDSEAGIAHVLGVGGAVRERTQEREDMLGEAAVHLTGRGVLEALPTKLLVGESFRVCAFGEDATG